MKKMKLNWLECRAAERRGVIVLSTLLLGSLCFRIWGHRLVRSESLLLDEKKYAAYLQFAERQQFLQDSIQTARARKKQLYAHNAYPTTNRPGTGKNSPPLSQAGYANRRAKVDLNQADSLDLQSIPGIGSKTAAQILRYRERLGGFVSMEQLLEVTYMDSSRYVKLLPYLCVQPSPPLQRININTATVEELKKHPYIDYYLAKSIVVRRKANGGYRNLEEMRSATKLYEELFDKLAPYLCVE